MPTDWTLEPLQLAPVALAALAYSLRARTLRRRETLAYVAAVRVVETVLGNVFVWSGAVFYGVYDRGEELWGVAPLQDQGLAGAPS